MVRKFENKIPDAPKVDANKNPNEEQLAQVLEITPIEEPEIKDLLSLEREFLKM